MTYTITTRPRGSGNPRGRKKLPQEQLVSNVIMVKVKNSNLIPRDWEDGYLGPVRVDRLADSITSAFGYQCSEALAREAVGLLRDNYPSDALISTADGAGYFYSRDAAKVRKYRIWRLCGVITAERRTWTGATRPFYQCLISQGLMTSREFAREERQHANSIADKEDLLARIKELV